MSATNSPAPDTRQQREPTVVDSEEQHSDDTPEKSLSQEEQPAHGESQVTDESTSLTLSTSAAATAEATSASGSTSASASASPIPAVAVTATAGDWQAVWSPAHNAYYFFNAKTQKTTWSNPLQLADASQPVAGPSTEPGRSSMSPEPPASAASMYALQAAAAAQGIDPALAHLDPSLAGPSTPGAFTYTAKFNARTGAFARADARDPSHLSEYERAKRMSEFYFDVNAWEHEVEARKLEEAQEEESKKRKRPTKKDLERFKEQKRQKKIAKTAWLRT